MATWAKKLAEPEVQEKIHKYSTFFWFIAAFPICLLLANSIPFIVFISVYAVVTGHWASWQASRTETLQKQSDKQMADTVQEIREILERIRELDKEAPFTEDEK